MRRYKKKDYTRRNTIIIGVFLIFIMMSSVIGFVMTYSQGGAQSGLSYNGFNFELAPDNSYVSTEVNDQELRFYSLPQDVEYIDLEPNAVNDINNAQMVMITFNPNDFTNVQYLEILRFDLDQYFLGTNTFTASGILEPDELGTYSAFPQIDCSNATASTPVIKLINDSTLRFDYEDNCLNVYGQGRDFITARDRLLFGLSGIIEDGN